MAGARRCASSSCTLRRARTTRAWRPSSKRIGGRSRRRRPRPDGVRAVQQNIIRRGYEGLLNSWNTLHDPDLYTYFHSAPRWRAPTTPRGATPTPSARGGSERGASRAGARSTTIPRARARRAAHDLHVPPTELNARSRKVQGLMRAPYGRINSYWMHKVGWRPDGSVSAERAPARTLIEGGDVVAFDGRGHRLLKGGAVVYEGATIVEATPSCRALRPRIDARGMLVCPGFINTHAHVGVEVMPRSRRRPRRAWAVVVSLARGSHTSNTRPART